MKNKIPHRKKLEKKNSLTEIIDEIVTPLVSHKKNLFDVRFIHALTLRDKY